MALGGDSYRVKIGICGLHYFPTCLVAFFSDPYFPFENFNFLIHLVYMQPAGGSHFVLESSASFDRLKMKLNVCHALLQGFTLWSMQSKFM